MKNASSTQPMNKAKDQVSELNLAIERLMAVAQSFEDEYIDASQEEVLLSIKNRHDHYINLYAAMQCMMMDIIRRVDEIDIAVTTASNATESIR